MKQLILLMISCLSLVACGNGNAKQERVPKMGRLPKSMK